MKIKTNGLSLASIFNIIFNITACSPKEPSKTIPIRIPSEAYNSALTSQLEESTPVLMYMTGNRYPKNWPLNYQKEEDGKISITLFTTLQQLIQFKSEENLKSNKFHQLKNFQIALSKENKQLIKKEKSKTYLQ